MKLRKFRIYFTIGRGGWDEGHLDIYAMNAEQAFHKAMKDYKHYEGFDVQSVEPLD